MPVPTWDKLMRPLLEVVSDGESHTLTEASQAVADIEHLTPEERNERIPSGEPRLYNRVSWAKHEMIKAGLLESPSRGIFRITERGLKVLKSTKAINVELLRQYDEYSTYTKANKKPTQQLSEQKVEKIEQAQTPQEIMEEGYNILKRALAQDLLAQVKKASPAFFERLVVKLLVAMGYGGLQEDAGRAVGRTGDEGIDGVIKEDKLGLDMIYIQAKRWEGSVSRPTVQAFAGSLEGQRARKGVLITTSTFTREAKEYVNRIEKRIVLLDGEQLAELMIEHNVGVAIENSYEVKRVDLDFFGDE